MRKITSDISCIFFYALQSLVQICKKHKYKFKMRNWYWLVFNGAACWCEGSWCTTPTSCQATNFSLLKGIVSRKFDMLLLVSLDRYKFSTPFLFYPFLKISSLSCRIFDYKMFTILLTNWATSDNLLTMLWHNKTPPLNVEYSKIWYENYDIF
jgi:hypothetical protein